VDCFDALTSDRPYRKALGREEALAFLGRESGKMFDPRVVGALIRNIDHLERSVPAEPAARPAPPRLPATAASSLLEESARDLPFREALAPFVERLRGLVAFKTLVVYAF